ncbi:MAG TPA: SMP-30/gluconolactonase/LRE family protein [Geminicoccaceae bacterium]|nr:SMP-30/gluconolactonase/LRE family protein [Geminicoccaceae bacterium]
MTEAERVLDAANVLGECPIWSVEEQALYWVDILAPAIHRLVPAAGEHRVWPLPRQPGSIGFREGGGLVAACRDGFCAIDLPGGAVTRLIDPEPDRPDNRFNDGRSDRAGRFWAGSMNDDHASATGALYRLDVDHTVRRMVDGLTIPNALCWSPDDRTMYHGDSLAGTIDAYDFDLATGSIANRRAFAPAGRVPGAPDGAVTDAEGCVWSARFGGSSVARYDPGGRVERTVRVPARQVTCCAFGGPDLTTLYVTTARENYTERDLRDDPLAGSVFAVEVGVRGVPEPKFRG